MKTLKFNPSRIKFLIGILLIIAVFMTMGARVHAFTWKTANQVTVAWDAVTQKDDGSDLAATDQITYAAYLANSVTDPNKTNPVEVYRGPATQAVMTMGIEGSYLVGIRAIRSVDGEQVSESIINWSDNPLATGVSNEFGIRYFLGPAAVKGLKPKPPAVP